MGANSGLDGGAIFAFGVALVTNSTLTNTTASNIGGGMSANDGNGVATAGTVANSTIANDVATNSGGGISSNGAVVVTNSTIANNTGAGLANGAIDAGSGTGVTITNSTIAFDTAHDLGGVVFTNGSVVVTNSTLSSNTTSQDGGAIFAASGVQLVYATTVMDNSAPRGANLADGGSPLTSFGSVVAHPHGGGTDCANLTGASKGWNWDDDGSCGFGGGPGDHSNAGDPQLGALANNGGATETRLPLTAAASSTRSQSPRAKPTGRPASRPTNVAVHDLGWRLRHRCGRSAGTTAGCARRGHAEVHGVALVTARRADRIGGGGIAAPTGPAAPGPHRVVPGDPAGLAGPGRGRYLRASTHTRRVLTIATARRRRRTA